MPRSFVDALVAQSPTPLTDLVYLQPLIQFDLQDMPPNPNAGLYTRYNLPNLASITLLRDKRLLGQINLHYVDASREFTPDEITLLRGLAEQASQAITNANLYIQAQRRLRQVEALRDIDIAIIGSVDLRITMGVILEKTMSHLNIDAADILLYNTETHTLDYAAGRGFRTKALEHTHLRLGESCAGQAALERKACHIPDLGEEHLIFKQSPIFQKEGFIAYYAVPLLSKGQIKGVLELFKRSPQRLDQEWQDFAQIIATQAAIAIDNTQLFDSLQRGNYELTLAYDTTLEGWAKALELRDQETEGHARRVTEMTERLARAMGISDSKLIHIRRGALLHDIGKMGVPDNILRKPGPLTEEEWGVMRQHPVFAYNFLSQIAYLHPALDIPYCHHEKWDGTGYPQGLKGEEIPLAARIFAIADVLDALTSDRPYRKAWSKKKTLEHIKAESGAHFDPKVVEMFFQMMKERKEDQ